MTSAHYFAGRAGVGARNPGEPLGSLKLWSCGPAPLLLERLHAFFDELQGFLRGRHRDSRENTRFQCMSETGWSLGGGIEIERSLPTLAGRGNLTGRRFLCR